MRFLNRPFLFIILCMAILSAIMHARIFNTEIVGPHAWRQTQTVANIQYFTRVDFTITQTHTHHFVDGSNQMRMEFPLLQWIIAAAFRLCGEEIWLMRAILFLIGIFTIAGMGKLAEAIFNRKIAGPVAAWTLCFSPLFYYYTMNPLPDLLALCCATWGLAGFFRWNKTQSRSDLFLSVAMLAIATLCKLPFVVFYAVYLGWFINVLRTKPLAINNVVITIALIIASLIGPALWYTTVMREWSPNLVTSGILDSTLSASEIFTILSGTLISTLPELLLNFASVPLFLLGAYFFIRRKKNSNPHVLPLVFLTAGVLFYYGFEINAISLIHDYYLLPFLPILFLIVTYGVLRMEAQGGWIRMALVLCLIVLPLTAFLRSDSRWNESDPGFNADLVAYKDELRKATPADAKIVIGNDESAHIGLYYANRDGWNFHHNNLTPEELSFMINSGAQYLYSDSREIEKDPLLMPFFGETTAVIGSFHIIRLNSEANR